MGKPSAKNSTAKRNETDLEKILRKAQSAGQDWKSYTGAIDGDGRKLELSRNDGAVNYEITPARFGSHRWQLRPTAYFTEDAHAKTLPLATVDQICAALGIE